MVSDSLWERGSVTFTTVNERLATVRIKPKFFKHIANLCPHTDGRKDDVKYGLGDYTARVGKEDYFCFGKIVRKFMTKQPKAKDLRLIDLASTEKRCE